MNREKEERLQQRVESLSCELNDANERTRSIQKEKEEKEMEIVELNRRAEAALATARVVQERQTEQENVSTDGRVNDRSSLRRRQLDLKLSNGVSLC